MRFEYYPGDIAAAFCGFIGEENPAIIDNITGALYDLKAICENRHNSEYYRDMYRVLERMTMKIEEV